jgi:hypothetical protein
MGRNPRLVQLGVTIKKVNHQTININRSVFIDDIHLFFITSEMKTVGHSLCQHRKLVDAHGLYMKVSNHFKKILNLPDHYKIRTLLKENEQPNMYIVDYFYNLKIQIFIYVFFEIKY